VRCTVVAAGGGKRDSCLLVCVPVVYDHSSMCHDECMGS
jgi:hypothetical protein